MPPVRKPDEDRLAVVEGKLDRLLDAFKDLDENRNRSVRETLARVKAIAVDEDDDADDADDDQDE
jgi:hypothetical protein